MLDISRYPQGLQQVFLQLNPAQLDAVQLNGGKAAILGVPGAGKTRALISLLARCVADGVNPTRILAMTFTRNAAREMSSRLLSIGIPNVTVGTIHSVCNKILHASVPSMMNALKLDDRNRMDIELKILLNEMQRSRDLPRHGMDRGGVQSFIAACKSRGTAIVENDPFQVNMRLADSVYIEGKRWYSESGLGNSKLATIYKKLDFRRVTKGLYNFDDMLLWTWMLLIGNADNLQYWRSQYDMIIVDEAQDSNPVQWDLARLLAGMKSCILRPEGAEAKGAGGYIETRTRQLPTGSDDANTALYVYGDPSQCHPAGTKIQIGSREWRNIEDLVRGDVITRWDRHAQYAVHTGVVKETAVHKHSGSMHRIQVDDTYLDCTPGHKFLCRWTDRTNKSVWVTYMMHRRDLGYRVGWCKLFINRKENDNSFHLGRRALIEKADAAWILRVHYSKDEASIYESYVAAHWGLPTIMFQPKPNTNPLYTADNIKAVYKDMNINGENTERALTCLQEHHRDGAYPLYPWPEPKIGRTTYFIVHAANIMQGIMSIPLPEGRNNWQPVVRNTSRQFEGSVYSLDVSHDKLYIANGIVTHNSIYRFRHAEPKLFVEFAKHDCVKRIPLPYNYRSTPGICALGSAIVADKSWHLCGEMIPSGVNSDDDMIASLPVIKGYSTPEGEAAGALKWAIEIAVDHPLGLNSCVILSRTSMALNLAEIECIRQRIPYRKMASGNFFSSKEIKDLLAYIKVASGADSSTKTLRRIVNAPFRFIGRPFLDMCESEARKENVAMLDMLQELIDEAPPSSARNLKEFISLLTSLNRIAVSGAQDALDAKEGGTKSITRNNPGRMLAMVLQRTDYIAALRAEEGLGEDDHRLAAIYELQRIAELFQTTSEFLDYVTSLERAIAAASKPGGLKLSERNQQPALTLSTIHRAKGLEWENVRVIDMVEGRFPHSKAQDEDEELRLLFVAITRAKKECVLTHSCGIDTSENEHVSNFLLIVQYHLEIITTSENHKGNKVEA